MLIWILAAVLFQKKVCLESQGSNCLAGMWHRASKILLAAVNMSGARLLSDCTGTITCLAQGRSRRSVSGSSSRFLHDHGDAEYARVRDRLGQELPLHTCRQIDTLVNSLDRMWLVLPTPNDREFIRQLGNADDPSKASTLQRFQMLLHTAATERRIPTHNGGSHQQRSSTYIVPTFLGVPGQNAARRVPKTDAGMDYRKQNPKQIQAASADMTVKL